MYADAGGVRAAPIAETNRSTRRTLHIKKPAHQSLDFLPRDENIVHQEADDPAHKITQPGRYVHDMPLAVNRLADFFNELPIGKRLRANGLNDKVLIRLPCCDRELGQISTWMGRRR